MRFLRLLDGRLVRGSAGAFSRPFARTKKRFSRPFPRRAASSPLRSGLGQVLPQGARSGRSSGLNRNAYPRPALVTICTVAVASWNFFAGDALFPIGHRSVGCRYVRTRSSATCPRAHGGERLPGFEGTATLLGLLLADSRRPSPHFSRNRMLLRSAMGFSYAAGGGHAGLWRRMRGSRSDVFWVSVGRWVMPRDRRAAA
jgi:hypothetical protein